MEIVLGLIVFVLWLSYCSQSRTPTKQWNTIRHGTNGGPPVGCGRHPSGEEHRGTDEG